MIVLPQVSDRRAEYNKLKQTNEEEEDILQAQIKGLQMELEDKRLDHRSKEGLIERDLAERMNKIESLRQSIKNKEEEFCDKTSASSPFLPSAPADLYDPIFLTSTRQEEQPQPVPSISSTAHRGKSMDSLMTSAASPTAGTRSAVTRRKYDERSEEIFSVETLEKYFLISELTPFTRSTPPCHPTPPSTPRSRPSTLWRGRSSSPPYLRPSQDRRKTTFT